MPSLKLFNSTRKFAVQQWSFSTSEVQNEKNYIKSRLRYNLATAAYGSIAANQVLIEEDSQIAKAVEALPRAGQLAVSARKSLPKK